MNQESIRTITVYTLTEDNSTYADRTTEAVVREMLKLVDPAIQTHKIAFRPGDSRGGGAIKGLLYRSRKQHVRQAKVELRRYLADLVRDPSTLIFVHSDGDCKWSDRPSSNAASFESELRIGIKNRLEDVGELSRHADERIFLLMPYYSIEAWL